MRYTLEQLKAMSNEELHELWAEAVFPFENMQACGQCLTSHNPGYSYSCNLSDAQHEQLRNAMSKFPFEGGLNLHPYLEELYALRLFYDHLYPQPEPAEEKQLQQALALECERVSRAHADRLEGLVLEERDASAGTRE